jgi:hypothetical protein
MTTSFSHVGVTCTHTMQMVPAIQTRQGRQHAPCAGATRWQPEERGRASVAAGRTVSGTHPHTRQGGAAGACL